MVLITIGNGFIDDVNGWNFADNTNSLIDIEMLQAFNEDCL